MDHYALVNGGVQMDSCMQRIAECKCESIAKSIAVMKFDAAQI
jgi:hypothetical protein